MRPGQLTPENLNGTIWPTSTGSHRFNEAGAINPGKRLHGRKRGGQLLASMRPGQLTPENVFRALAGAPGLFASMRPGQLTPENRGHGRGHHGRRRASMRPGQLTPENFP